MLTVLLSALFLPISAAHSGQGRDIILADFEGSSYGKWQVTGTAFGKGPAQGTLLGQMIVGDFEGKGLANSYGGGDQATGALTSPPFKIERKYIRFRVGGGKNPAQLAIRLLIGGKVVRSATGNNERPGGSENLILTEWDVSEFSRQTGVIEIIDQATGPWGHINVDGIRETNKRLPRMVKQVETTVQLKHQFLNLPIKNGGPKRWMTVSIPGEAPKRFEIELADNKPDWWAFIDVARFKGKAATILVDELPEDSLGLSSIKTAPHIEGSRDLYCETYRPQFHFTSRRGWLNDPNGLVSFDGEYHLFYQHNPYGWAWGNMSWGHAVSKDLVHWTELPVALDPDPLGTMYSGSAVVDWNNTAGFAHAGETALVAMYTAAGKPFTQGLAYSNDRGRTWTKYAGNPTMGHIAAENRDPKVIWFAPTNKWVMALYLDGEDFGIYTSSDLKQWTQTDKVTLPGTSECPNFFLMPVDGDRKKMKWVFIGANGGYKVGDFDGNHFTEDGPSKWMQAGNCWYASQVFSDIPESDGRSILIPWGQFEFPGMPFNQMMGIPVELTLHSSPGGVVIASNPVRELKQLRQSPETLVFDGNLHTEPGDLFEFEATIEAASGDILEWNIRGVKVTYDASKGEITCLDRHAAIRPVDGRVKLRVLVDRTSIDIFGNDGRVYIPMGSLMDPANRTMTVTTRAGHPKIPEFNLYRLRSSWR